jgi:predicted N-acyltransferase
MAADPNDPFTTHRFLRRWRPRAPSAPAPAGSPRHLVARCDGEVIACAPLYAKGHSQGEYIFDHNWAHAYERAGGRYYPKLQMAVPFTPATGRRFLTRPGWEETGARRWCRGRCNLPRTTAVSSLHVTFCTEGEARDGEAMGLMRRSSQQFHWLNDGYADFDAFLGALSSRKRKNIRKERERAQAFGGEIRAYTGDALRPEHWDAFWVFYQDTGARKWGMPYLTRAFFDGRRRRCATTCFWCWPNATGGPVAGALNFIGRDTLFGRYWGCIEDHPCLHFELCYYQAIDFAIAHGMGRVEAGAQGQHKLARGYLPVTTHSLHWVRDAGFAEAIAQYLEAEREAVDQEIEVLTSWGPFRKAHVEEQE